MGCNSRQILDDPLDQNKPCQIYKDIQSVQLTPRVTSDYKIFYDCNGEVRTFTQDGKKIS